MPPDATSKNTPGKQAGPKNNKNAAPHKTQAQRSLKKQPATPATPHPGQPVTCRRQQKPFKSGSKSSQSHLPLFYQHHPLLPWLQHQLLAYLRRISRDKTLHKVQKRIHLNHQFIAQKLNTPAKTRSAKTFISAAATSLHPDVKILVWDYLAQAGLPPAICLEPSAAPDLTIFRLPVPAVLRTALRALVVMGYAPDQILTPLSRRFPALSLTLEMLQNFNTFFWNIGDLMDTQAGEAALSQQLRRFSQINKTGPDQRRMTAPYFNGQGPDHTLLWSDLTDQPIGASFQAATQVLSGEVPVENILLDLGFLPPQFLDVETHLREEFGCSWLGSTEVFQAGNVAVITEQLNDVMLPYAKMLRQLGIPAVLTDTRGQAPFAMPAYSSATELSALIQEAQAC